MKLRSFNKFSGIIVLLLFSFSCASDLDFNQVNDAVIEPVILLNLAYFDVPAKDFVSKGVEQNMLYDAPVFDIFNGSFFKQRLKKVELFFEMQNTINRAYSVDLVFLDKNKQAVHSLNLAIPRYTGTENKVIKKELFENAQLDLLKTTMNIAFTIKMLPGDTLNESSLGNLKLRSGLTAYLVIE